MPPSPALRYSPGRELRGEGHKRVRSFESGILFREKDEDLALFNELQNKEREDFLLKSTDDFEDTFSTKLRHFSDYKLGVTVPARGSSELLIADEEKNDYDWLLTPPDTPLFPSLDDDPQPANTARSGRPRSQPISLSRSSTMDKSYRSSRGSASPNRLSPSPRSGNSAFQWKDRPSSAPRTSPSPSVRSATPTRRASTPSKTSTSAPRSSTPNSQRMSTGVATSGLRRTSPIRSSRGNSASPKITAWQSNIPGFSLEAPPNLRTSLADRPASYVRGSSPASRNGRGRQSMSPTATRSVSSSHSHDRDRFSSHSKGSVASSGDDEVDSLQSVSLGVSNISASRKVGGISINRAPTFNKKSARVLSPSSAPKRSFDSALHLMDNRKSPANMFRPLLSSVPSNSFYVGKGSAAHRSMISRNSSVTTSSNASSDQGACFLLDTEASDPHQDDLVGERGERPSMDVREEVFVFDKVDALSHDGVHEPQDSSYDIPADDFNGVPAIKGHLGNSEVFSNQNIEVETGASFDAFRDTVDVQGLDDLENTKVCLRCNYRYHFSELVDEDIGLCPNCSRQKDILPVTHAETLTLATKNSDMASMKLSEDSKSLYEVKASSALADSQSQVTDIAEPLVSQHEEDVKKSRTKCLQDSQARSLVEGGKKRLSYQQGMDQHTVDQSLLNKDTGAQTFQLNSNNPESKGDHSLLDRDVRGQRLEFCNNPPIPKVCTSEVVGISVLLKRSSSSKGPVTQGKTFSASSLHYEDMSYTRDSSSSWRSSIGYGSASASSSIDYGSSRQTETRVQRQSSGRRSDTENYRYDITAKPRSVGSSLSRSSSNAHQASGSAASTREENFELNASILKTDAEESPAASEAKLLPSTGAVHSEEVFETSGSCRTADPHTSELPSNVVNAQPANYEDGPEYSENADCDLYYEPSGAIPESSVELIKLKSSLDGMDVAEVPAHGSLVTISEADNENHSLCSPGSKVDCISPNSERNKNEFVVLSVPAPSDVVDIKPSALELNSQNHRDGILEEESYVSVETQVGSKMRSLTLEEATDTILFCSSIVHDLAYQAATVAIEKESSAAMEDSRPTSMVFGKSNYTDREEPTGRKLGRRASKSLKAKQKKMETDKKLPSTKTENDENVDEYSSTRNVGLPNKEESAHPQKLESKCNCSIM